MMLFGKTIVVTGISSGIGARVGELAVALGADVIGVDIKEPARPLDAFIRADISSARGAAEIAEAPGFCCAAWSKTCATERLSFPRMREPSQTFLSLNRFAMSRAFPACRGSRRPSRSTSMACGN